MKFFQFLSIAFVFFFLTGFVQAEEVKDFSAVYIVETSGEVMVIETIAYDFGEESRRGIFRNLNNNHPQPATSWYKSRYVDIEVLSVFKNNSSEPYQVSGFGNSKEIRIGDEDIYISGEHIYNITYKLRGALSYGTDGSELYWNATGNGWEVPMRNVLIEVRGDAIAGEVSCYQGELGSTESCVAEEGEGEVVFSATNLAAGEGLTIAIELDREQIEVLILEMTANFISIGLQVLFLVGLIWWLVLWYRQDKLDKPVIAQYEPYQNYLPMYTGVLFDKRLDPHDITAGILYLAEQGFFSITKTERKALRIFKTTDYDITLLRPLSEIPTHFLADLVEILFPQDASLGTTVAISSLAKNQTENYHIIQKLQKDISADIKASGFIRTDNLFADKKNIFLAVVFAILLALWSIILLIVSIAVVLFFLVISRRTTKGYEALNHIEGFKLFLSVTEKERYKFFNAPERSPELFMKYLPYAVALKVEAQWAKVFEGIIIPAPSWYHGSTAGNFSALALVNDIGSFSSTFSSSSGTSGSSGGGAVGGGGGGGGGGSW
ncbi:MAG: DUF2207 domain-containing protein [Candidatus Paceibacteria bacterium]